MKRNRHPRRRAAVWACLAAALTGCASQRVFWGDVHGHTANSDGKGTVDQYLAYARDVVHLDFVIVTDHDFGNSAPWRMPLETWTRTQESVERVTVDGEFVAIAGYEWTSQPKYWTGYHDDTPSEGLFEGPPRYYNHKNVYFPRPVPYLLSAKDVAYRNPDLLAKAVRKLGGLIHNNHPGAGADVRDQWDYDAASAEVIANTEIGPDRLWYDGKRYDTEVESVVRAYLDRGGKTGFVSGSDTHEGTPEARTAVLARDLSRDSLFEALRHRRCYAISHARILLDFRVNGHWMGEEIETSRAPRISVDVRGTDSIAEVVVVRNGSLLRSYYPGSDRFRCEFTDDAFPGSGYYYVRVTQRDTDPHGNPSRAWSSPIWVRGPATALDRSRNRDEP